MLAKARELLNGYADTGEQILPKQFQNSNYPGGTQTYFAATPGEKADFYLNTISSTLDGVTLIPGMPNRDADRLAHFSALNGSVEGDFLLEENIIGGKFLGSLAGSIGRGLKSLDAYLLERYAGTSPFTVPSAGSRASVAGESAIDRNGTRTLIDQNLVSDIGNVACGPTCGAMIFNDGGQSVNIINLAKMADIQLDGTTVKKLTRALNESGLVANFSLNATVGEIGASTAKGNAAIAMMDLGETMHYVGVDGVTKRNGISVVAIRDPDRAQQYFMSVEEFSKKFNGSVIFTRGSGK